jgi:hypothetical protein
MRGVAIWRLGGVAVLALLASSCFDSSGLHEPPFLVTPEAAEQHCIDVIAIVCGRIRPCTGYSPGDCSRDLMEELSCEKVFDVVSAHIDCIKDVSSLSCPALFPKLGPKWARPASCKNVFLYRR